MENAKAEAARVALAAFKKSEEYDGGWVAAKRCVCHSHPSID